jgi:hypothetical protein
MRSLAVYILVCVCLAGTAFSSHADVFTEGDHLQLYFGPYLIHYYYSADHNDYPWFIGAEWESASRWEAGAAYFRNSFYQPSGYVYGGKRFIYGSEESHLFLRVTLGAILGYVKPNENKIPINANGIGLGIIPAVGYKYKRTTVQCAFLGTVAAMFVVGYDVW